MTPEDAKKRIANASHEKWYNVNVSDIYTKRETSCLR